MVSYTPEAQPTIIIIGPGSLETIVGDGMLSGHISDVYVTPRSTHYSTEVSLWIQHENFIGAVGGRNASGEYDPQFHGFSGNVQTSLPWGEHTEHDRRVVQNAALQPEFPMVNDQNGGRPLGVST